jgi:hypothetical protein
MFESISLTPVRPSGVDSTYLRVPISFRLTVPLTLAVIVFSLSTLDGLATLRLTAVGIEEANPLMRGLLGWGPGPFLAGKFLLTFPGLCVCVATRGRRLFGTRLTSHHLLLGLAGLYAFLVIYELILWMLVNG